MKTQNKNLELNKKTLVELNENELKSIKGGSSSSLACLMWEIIF